MALTKEEKEQIAADETVRLSVRNNAKAKQPALLAFFNSALGIWILSSVVLGLISWQFSRYSQHQETLSRNAALLSKLKFDLLVLCDIGLSNITNKAKLSYNDISSTATLFRYDPAVQGEIERRYSVIEVLNEIAPISPNDSRVERFRKRSYELSRKTNTILDEYRGWISSSNPEDPIYNVKLTNDQKEVIEEIRKLLDEMRSFAENAS